MSTINPIDQQAQLQYFKWEDKFKKEKPYSLLMQGPKDFPKANFTREQGPKQKIEDIRGREGNLSLDKHGFTVRTQVLPTLTFKREDVEEKYLPLARKLLLEECGQDAEIFIFDWRLRSSDERKTSYNKTEKVNLADPELVLRPAEVVHVDQTPNAVRRRIQHHLPDKAGELMNSKRIRIINVWRPIVPVVEDYPLACCDGSTVQQEDMVAVDTVRKSFVGESWHVMYRDYYRWYYLSKQTKDEVLLIKMADSNEAVPARYCPHTSFKIDGVTESVQPRESIEVRAIVFNHG